MENTDDRNQPKISVIMGAYNARGRLKKSVESIIHQEFTDWELIICDDGSTDDTYEVILELAKEEPRIVPLKNNRNRGLAYTLNHCIAVSKGEFLARMDDDDYSHPDRFTVQYAFLCSHPDIAIVGAAAFFVDSVSVWGELYHPECPVKYDIWKGRSFIHPTVMMRKAAVLQCGLYSVGKYVGRTEDYDLWCKLYAAGFQGYNLQARLLDYYEDRRSLSKRKYIYRIYETRLKLLWRKSLDIPALKIPIAFLPMLYGLVPAGLMKRLRLRKYGR